MTSTTAAGSTLAISAALPATNDAAGFAALTFTEVGGVEKIGALGATFAKVEFKPLKGPVEKHKGSVDYGSLQPSMAHNDADAGQTLMRTAGDDATSKLYSFKVTYADGAIRYFQGRVFGYPETTDGADTILMAAPTIEISTKVVKVAAPA
ncbi:hypothetical protein PX699_00380 [Sphingobium sp. H39-3-25]|jgi:hypothetical protein|uniref:hypothetical protein n=1 Tax=Sphingobium arseniciresistens TaxID=3030834 RepID=UPI0023BA324A|nr:hypothetical protein [Sphingobium arseniciresistens]